MTTLRRRQKLPILALVLLLFPGALYAAVAWVPSYRNDAGMTGMAAGLIMLDMLVASWLFLLLIGGRWALAREIRDGPARDWRAILIELACISFMPDLFWLLFTADSYRLLNDWVVVVTFVTLLAAWIVWALLIARRAFRTIVRRIR